MDTSLVQYELKLKKLLTKFLEPGYRLGNDVYLNILLSHLSGQKDEVVSKDLKRLPIFIEWLETALVQWESSHVTPSPSIITFTLNLSSLISVNEENFIRLNNDNFYLRLCKVLKLRSNDVGPSVKLGYLKMLNSFLNHRAGLEWLVATDHWNDILNFCLDNPTIYITRDGYTFMYLLLSKFINIHPTFCELIVKKIMNVLLEKDYINSFTVKKSEIDEVQFVKDLKPTLNLLNFILEKSFLSDVDFENKILTVFTEQYNLEVILWKLLVIARDSELLFNISKLLYVISFSQIDVEKMANRETSLQVMTEFAKKFFQLFNTFITKRHPVNILKLCHLGHIYWKKFSVQIPSCSPNKEPIVFENQLIIYQIMPILYIAFSTAYKKDIQKDELTEMFIHKLFKISCEHTIRCCYSYRSLLMSYDTLDYDLSKDTIIFDFGQKAIFYLMKTRQYFHRDRAVIVFQALMYAMKYLSKSLINKAQAKISDMSYQPGFLSAMFEGLSVLIQDFKITWRESVETICLTSLCLDFIKLPNLPTKVEVQCLKLINLSIANFMPPNLALLVDEISDSSITAITPMLANKIYAIEWEIRDGALEILNTVIDIAHLKYPAFQKMVLDAKLCQAVVRLITEDSESFVRVSAIKCVTSMIQVPAFWNDCLVFEDLPIIIMNILHSETEALVRCEAVKLMCEIYEHEYVNMDLMNEVFISLGAAASQDLHWEVQVNGLTFWEKVISREMSNQGMIDGVFPSVTFSKEHKKIVTLNEPVIQSRLNKVLINLSKCGCLGVLIATMQDDCDFLVCKKSVEVTKRFKRVLEKYNALKSHNSVDGAGKSRSCWDTFSNSSNEVNFHHHSDDDRLQNASNVNHSDSNCELSKLQIIEPEKFLSVISADLDVIVNEKSKWLQSNDDLNSLLDDILKSYEDNDTNTMECY